jgi:hypothetical protein
MSKPMPLDKTQAAMLLGDAAFVADLHRRGLLNEAQRRRLLDFYWADHTLAKENTMKTTTTTIMQEVEAKSRALAEQPAPTFALPRNQGGQDIGNFFADALSSMSADSLTHAMSTLNHLAEAENRYRKTHASSAAPPEIIDGQIRDIDGD